MLTGSHTRMQGLRNNSKGFSLLELMLVLAISAILLALAMPSMQSIRGDSEISATTNNLVHGLQTARSEAIKRSARVGLCPSADPLANSPVCGGRDYTAGWIVFSDANDNGIREGAEDVILQSEESSPGFTITPDTVFRDRVYFSESGTSINPAGIPLAGNVRIALQGQERRDVSIAANGRITTSDPDEP